MHPDARPGDVESLEQVEAEGAAGRGAGEGEVGGLAGLVGEEVRDGVGFGGDEDFRGGHGQELAVLDGPASGFAELFHGGVDGFALCGQQQVTGALRIGGELDFGLSRALGAEGREARHGGGEVGEVDSAPSLLGSGLE